jgi:hypothetical protein
MNEKLIKEIEGAILKVLTKRESTPEDGLTAMMNAVLDILHNAALVFDEDPKKFIKSTLTQILNLLDEEDRYDYH